MPPFTADTFLVERSLMFTLLPFLLIFAIVFLRSPLSLFFVLFLLLYVYFRKRVRALAKNNLPRSPLHLFPRRQILKQDDLLASLLALLAFFLFHVRSRGLSFSSRRSASDADR